MKTMTEKKKLKEDIKQVQMPSLKKMNQLNKIGTLEYIDPTTKDITNYHFFNIGSIVYYYTEDSKTIIDQDVSPTEYGDL